ncbi:MAG: hypothetical protein AAGG01_15745, partial [Planctomycetota bacterium]
RQLPWIIAFVVILFQVYRLLPLAFTHRGRRILRGKWRRVTSWELWPPYLTYLPLIPWLVWLAIRHRSPLAFTASNPAMPMGGLVGESKAAILEGLGADQPEVPAFRLLLAADAPETRAQAAEAFLDLEGIDLPVILKPNEGQRGSGVALVKTREDLRERAHQLNHDGLLQERIHGEEFGVFYVREPGHETGRIFSVTTKELPEVVGDGARTVEELLLEDPRASALHKSYLKELGTRADEVPLVGERVRLVEVGTHSRGAIFRDGSRLITPELTEAVERLSSRYEGFHFGRYDVRTASAEAFSRGEGLRVIELNGVTSEATRIYDPDLSALEAYRVLFRQWELAYAIGAANRAKGAPVATIRGALAEWFRYLRKQRSHRT